MYAKPPMYSSPYSQPYTLLYTLCTSPKTLNPYPLALQCP